MNVGIRETFVYRETGAQKTCGQRIHFRYENSLAVQRSAGAAGSGEQLVIKRIVDHPGEKCAALRKCNGNRETRVAVSEISRPIERVHMPAKFRAAFVPASLFRRHRV